MGAPYIARAPKKVLVRIPRNEGYTTVPSGMATLRLIPSPLDKPQETENTQTESRGASPLDRPPQFTTGIPTAYSRSLHSGQPSVVPSGTVASGPVQLGRGPGAASVQSEADRFVALQGRGVVGPRGRAAAAAAAGAVYQNERSSSPAGLHQHGLAPPPSSAGATGTTSAHGPRATPLHYQGHFTAHAGRCHQGVTHSATGSTRQQHQQPPPFTDFIAGQVWRALMMASQQQQQQQQRHQQQLQLQQQHHQAVSGGVAVRGPVVGGKRTRDVATASSLPATQEDADDEPNRKISRVAAAAAASQVQHAAHPGGLQDAPQHTPQAVIYTTPAVSHTGLHINMPSPPSSPTTTSSPQHQVYTTRFHTSIPTPPTTPPSIQHPCSPTLDDTAQLAHPESPKLLLAQSQQPLVPLSPPALSLPIMFPPVFPQSMNSIKSHPQQFSLGVSSSSSSSNNNSSGPVAGAVSGSGGRGQGAPPHQQQQTSQLTVVAGVSPRPTHPLHRLSHHHPLAALLQPTHGLLPVSAAHGVEVPVTAMNPYLAAAAAATAPPTPMMRMVDRSGPEYQQHHRTRSPGQYRGLPLYTSSSSTNSNNTNDKTSYSRTSIRDTTSSSRRALHAHTAGAAVASPSSVHSDTSNTTSLTSHCT